MNTTLTLRTDYAMGGETVRRTLAAEKQPDGSWQVALSSVGGTTLWARSATAEECVEYDARLRLRDSPLPEAAEVVVVPQQSQINGTQAKLDALTVLLRAVVDTLPAESRSAVEAALAASGA